MIKKYDTLVLSGNSTNGIVTLGALQYLYDNKLIIPNEIKNFIGTSSGSIISLLLFVGYTPLELLTFTCVEKIFKKFACFNVSNVLLYGKSLMKFEPIQNILETLIKDKLGFIPTIKQIEQYNNNKRLFFTTYNLTTNKREYISSDEYGDLLVTHGIQMSSSYPFIFEPYLHNNNLYIDGGIVDNFPIEFANSIGENCLGIITINPFDDVISNNIIEFLLQLFHIHMVAVDSDKINRTSSDVIQLKCKRNFFNFDNNNKEIINMFDNGYELCKQCILIKNEA